MEISTLYFQLKFVTLRISKIENRTPMAEENKQQNGNYSADNITALKGLEAVRVRPGMYVGGTDVRALHHLVNEVLDNSIDEALAGYCSRIDIIIDEEGYLSVRDNGRGIPVGRHSKSGRSALELVMTELHAGGKFNKDNYKVSGGLNGVGVSCVNALSEHLVAEVRREGKVHIQEYRQGKPQFDVKVVGEAEETGTTVRFKPDSTIFDTTVFNYDTLKSRIREMSFLNAGVRITITDHRVKDEKGASLHEDFYSEEGLPEFVKYLDKSRQSILENPIHVSADKDNVEIEVAMQYNTGYAENIFSYANNIQTPGGGTHVNGFKRAITRLFKDYGDENGLFSKLKFEVKGEDFREGLTAVVSIKIPEPQFKSQTKDEISNAELTSLVSSAVGNVLKYWLEENPKQARLIIDKVIVAAQARHAARKARELVQRKNVLVGSGLPGKLADCTSKNAEESEIFLVEGDSAGGTAKQGRDRFFQAIMPLRGKILNVEKAMEYKIFENEEIKNIYTALGVRVGTEEDAKALNLEKLRYHKIVIMCDADVDGSHISTLLMTFFFRKMKPLIEQGYLYVASPPLYQVKKGKKAIYCWNEEDRKNAAEQLGGADGKGVSIQRYKGLGEMNAEQLWETTMDPTQRRMKLITIENAAQADATFSMLMGDEVPPRREFIEENAHYANVDI